VQEGWDWNRVPGATTIHLPYPELESPLPGTLMERNPERFSGASSLEGRNGILALHFVEKAARTVCSHDLSALTTCRSSRAAIDERTEPTDD